MNDQSRVAVIILNWNGYNDTAECLASLKRSDYPDYTVVLVDNGSSHEEGKKLQEQFSDIMLIQNTENRGFAGGNNDGINWAIHHDYDYIVNLNNDCIVEKDWLTKLVNGLKTHEADFGSSLILFYDEKDVICSDEDKLLPDGSIIPINRYKHSSQLNQPRQIFSACGAGSIYSRCCLEDTKLKENQYFDELHFAYYEDADLGMRLHSKAYTGVLIPEARIYHKHSRTAGRYSDLKTFHSEKNRILNEILNFPIYLWVVGESFFLIKLCLGFISSLWNKESKGERYRKNVGALRLIGLMFKARWWILTHLPVILADRRERKRKKLINHNIYKVFHWNIGDFLR